MIVLGWAVGSSNGGGTEPGRLDGMGGVVYIR